MGAVSSSRAATVDYGFGYSYNYRARIYAGPQYTGTVLYEIGDYELDGVFPPPPPPPAQPLDSYFRSIDLVDVSANGSASIHGFFNVSTESNHLQVFGQSTASAEGYLDINGDTRNYSVLSEVSATSSYRDVVNIKGNGELPIIGSGDISHTADKLLFTWDFNGQFERDYIDQYDPVFSGHLAMSLQYTQLLFGRPYRQQRFWRATRRTC